MPDEQMTDRRLTPAKQALLDLRRRQARVTGALAPAAPRAVPGDGPFPLSYAQRRMWLLDQLNPGLVAYNSARVLRLRGGLDREALELALSGIIERHTVLRTIMRLEEGEPMQWIGPCFRVELEPLEISARADPAAATRELIVEELRRPFDLAGGALLRARLLRIAEDEHVLVLVLHHAASDEASKALLFDELGERYTAARAGRVPALAESPLRYADYAVWERLHTDSEVVSSRLDWWRRQLQGAPPELGLPHDRMRPPRFGFTGGRHEDMLTEGTLRTLRALAREEGATLFMVLLAAYLSFLARYTGRDDIVVGAPMSTRAAPGLEGVLGMFANTIVLRVSLVGDPRLRELVGRVRETVIAAFSHEVPFERLVEELGGRRDLSRQPIAETAFSCSESPSIEVPRLEGLEVTPVAVDPGVTKLDLSLTAYARSDGLRLQWEYNDELFSSSTVARMSGHFRTLLESVAADPDARVSALQLLSAAELATATGDLATTAAPIPPGTLDARIAAGVARWGEAPAVRCGSSVLTYRELDRRANGIARLLVDAGVPDRAVVALRLRRSTDLIASALGVMKAGCAYLPLDPALPELRASYMLADSRAVAVLTDDEGAFHEPSTSGPALPSEVTHPTRVLDLRNVIDAETPPERSGSASDVAYLIYTSGSTGRPKGVLVTHRSLLNVLSAESEAFDLRANDNLLAVTTLSFDIAAFELFAPLLVGACVTISDDGVASDPAALAELISKSGTTVMHAAPSIWRMLVDSGWTGRAGLRALTGGEVLTRDLAQALLSRTAELWNMYGPTETTIDSTLWRVRADDAVIPIGRPLANTACYVLDAHDQPVAPGVVGELCIGGVGVARGYHLLPELTAERFVADPFVAGRRMYRTGDRVRRRPDGVLMYVGRNDDQVKLNGVRIELGEIESTLARHPGVREVAVVLHKQRPEGASLVAYVTGEVSGPELQSHARRSLPVAMVPSRVVLLDRMPRTPNGKLDRAALPEPADAIGTAESAPPVGELETQIAAVWAEVLGAQAVGRHDEFFALGGHSLAAIRIVARVNAQLGLRLPARSLFEAPTVAAMAAVVEASQDGEASSSPALRRRPDRLARFPASSQQRRMWFLDRLDGAGALYTVPVCLGIDGPLEVRTLQQGLDELVVRHEALRTTLPSDGGVPLQAVHPPRPFALEEVTAADESAAEATVREATRVPFDLAEGPLARGVLIHISTRRHVLALIFHHAVVDAASMRILCGELTVLMSGGALPPPSPIQYGDYALWQQEALAPGARLDAELDWWRGQLEGAPAELDLPLDRPRTGAAYGGRRHVMMLPTELLAQLDALATERGATRFMVLTTAVQILLARYAGETDIVVGAPVAGLPLPELERVVGLFANTVVLRTQLGGDPSFEDALWRVKQVTLDALAHQDVPFERVVEELVLDRDLARNPLFQVLITVQDDRLPVPDLPGARVELRDVDRGVARFDLSLSFSRRDEGLRVACEYSTQLFDHATIVRITRHLGCLLEGIVANPAERLSNLPLMPASESRILTRLAASVTAIPEVPVHELVAEQASQRPEQVAVTCRGQSITYSELDVRANRLAAALIDAGAGPGTLVGLALDRSVDLLVGIHGVLRAGAAYVPLDPDYPRKRLTTMLSHARAPLLVTRSDLRDALGVSDARVICTDDPDLERQAPSRIPTRAGLGDLAYVIFTSGSSGQPKGVMVEHRSLVNLLSSMAEHPGLQPGETMLGLTTPAFDLSVPDLYLPLLCGGTLALATAEEATDPRRLANLLQRTGATVMQATPSTWRMLLDDDWLPERRMRVVVGGEAVSVALAKRLSEVMEEAWNFYGPTETCVWSTCWRISGDLEGMSTVPIGRPIGNTACYVVDASGSRVPIGVPGELWIGGLGVARGYLAPADGEEARFAPDPFRSVGRVYRTGDRARVNADGLLEFIGRRDHQVKLRGFRIELEEIARALERHEAVREAVAVVREDDIGEQRLLAYAVADRHVETGELLDHLRLLLPRYMVPGSVIELDRLPLTPNGKLDLKALPMPVGAKPARSAAPLSLVESQLMELWEAALRRTDIGVGDNLFHLGAHSLLITRVVARIRDTLGVELPLRRIYETPTVAEIASEIVSILIGKAQDDDLESLLAELEQAP